jgi:PadR family transcriptional regulator, regulatory protein AphA
LDILLVFFRAGFAVRRFGMKTKEYAMLAALAHRPRSGYDLNRWFDEAASHFCTAGYSSVYPALNGFEREGLVVHETVPSDRGPERKVYSLTGEGREVLLEWAAEPASGPEVRDEQLVKALAYGLLPAERARHLLGKARDLHREKLAHYEELERKLEERRVRGEISEEAYLGTKLTLMRGVGAEESYIRWCEDAMSFVAGAAAVQR